MSKKYRQSSKREEHGSFKRLIRNTFLLSLIFSAGLIVGMRLAAGDPVVPLASLKKSEAPVMAVIDTGEERIGTDYSFYELLGSHDGGKEDDVKPEPPSPVEMVVPQRPEQHKSEQPQKKVEKAPSAPVEPESVKKEPAKQKELSSTPPPVKRGEAKKVEVSGAKFTLQIGSHNSKSEAEKEMKSLAQLGVEPYLLVVDVPERGTFYRVRVGKYATLTDARRAQTELQGGLKISSFVSPI